MNPPPSSGKKSNNIYCLRGRKFFWRLRRRNSPKPYIFVFYCVFCVFMHHWCNCGPFKHKIERTDAKMLIFNVRAKIWDFLNVWTQKLVRQKCPWNGTLVLFEYINLVKSSKFPKTVPSALRARESENSTMETPPLGSKFCNRNPSLFRGGGRNPTISNAWTFKRVRTGSYASLNQE